MGNTTVAPERRLRVSLIGCTGVLGDIIRRTVAEQQDMEVVSDLESIPATGPLLVPADLMVWNDVEESRVEEWMRTMAEGSGTRVLATLGDGREAVLWELTPHRSPLGAPSPAALLETIRGATAAPYKPRPLK